MWCIPAKIVSTVPEDCTQAVDAEIVDVEGKRWQFTDKLVVFRDKSGRDSVRCTLQRLGREHQRLAYWVSTVEPDHVAATENDRSEFVVNELRFIGDAAPTRDELSRIPRRRGLIDIDFVQHDIAIALGSLPPGTGFADAKPHYWSAGGLGGFTLAVINTLVRERELVPAHDDETVFRWGGEFE